MRDGPSLPSPLPPPFVVFDYRRGGHWRLDIAPAAWHDQLDHELDPKPILPHPNTVKCKRKHQEADSFQLSVQYRFLNYAAKESQQRETLMLPNFFVVGAPKAGTTFLYNYLDQHPAIYMSPIKEPAFFAADLFERKRQLGLAQAEPGELRAYPDGPMTERRSGVLREWDHYLKLDLSAWLRR